MPLYSVATWDTELQAYTPQEGLSVPSINIPLWTLRQALRELRTMGYTAHRYRDEDGEHSSNDWCVMVERTDGMAESEILRLWQR
jgi:hypothetical protein